MSNLVMYLRLSLEDDVNADESNSITNQRRIIRDYISSHTKMTRDGGKDIIIKQNDIWGKTISYVQCKNRRGKIGVSCVKEFHSTIVNDKINRGIIVSTSGFTHDAEKYIEKNGLENIVILHNGKDVRELFKMVSNLT